MRFCPCPARAFAFTMKKVVLFDLDGTLTDPFNGITNSVAYALKKFGIDVDDRRSLACFIGPPLVDSFIEYYGFSRADAETAVVYYREYFADKGLYENELYPGVSEMLENLKSQGLHLVLATSKPERFAKIILDYFDLTKYFDYVCGASFDSSRSKKGDVISYALSTAKVNLCDKIIMVGDRKHDVIGARKNGIDTIGVLYGYGDESELNESGAKFVVSTISELTQLLLKI